MTFQMGYKRRLKKKEKDEGVEVRIGTGEVPSDAPDAKKGIRKKMNESRAKPVWKMYASTPWEAE
jgi:hypothetical protein